MIVTRISQAVKTVGRYNVFVDGEYSFSLDELQLVELGLKQGQEIDDNTLENFKDESNFGKNYIRALDLISRRIRSEKEIRDYAWRKKWTPDNTDRVIKRLYKNNYLDDEKFAQAFISSRSSKPMSLKKLKIELAKKGIKQDIIDNVILSNESFDESIALKKLIEKKQSRYDDERKLTAYLMGQGFRYDDIVRCLDEAREEV